MLKRKIACLLTLCMIVSLWTLPARAGEKPNTSKPESSQESSVEESSMEESSVQEPVEQEETVNSENTIEKGSIKVILWVDGELKEGKIAAMQNRTSDQVYFGLASLCQLLDLKCDLRPQYAQVTAGERCFDFYKDSCEVAFIGFTSEPVYDLAEPALFEQKDGKTLEVWVLPEALTELVQLKGVTVDESSEAGLTPEDSLMLYPEEAEKEVRIWLEEEKKEAEIQPMDPFALPKMIVFQQVIPYDEYLKEVLIPEKGLAAEKSQKGILSADIRDYNADGTDDLLVLELVDADFDGTFIQLMELAEYGRSTAGRKCLAIQASFYTFVDNEISKTDEYLVQMISKQNTGTMKVHLIQMEDTWYLSARSGWEDWNTVGDNYYCPTLVLSVDSNGQFLIRSVYGTMSFGQHGAGVHPEVLNVVDAIDFTDTVVKYGAGMSAEKNTLLCEVEILRDTTSFTFTDHTSLRQALEEGFDAVKPVRGNIDDEYQKYLEQQEQNKNEEEQRVSAFTETYGEQLESIRNFVVANAGAGLAKEEIKLLFPTDHRISLVLTFENNVFARFFFEEETGELLSMAVEVTGKDENKQAWIQLKDTVLMCPDLPFGAYQQYMGNVKSISDDKLLPGWRFSTVYITSWMCHIDKVSN